MLRHSLFAGTVGITLALGSMALAQEPRSYKSVDVVAELAAVSNPAAAAYWGTLEQDLEAAIAARLGDRIGTEGTDIEIDIEEMELSSGFTEQMGLADTRLSGQVRLRDDEDRSAHETFNLTVDVNQVRPLLAPDVDLAALQVDPKVFYDAMIAAYASAVVDRLP